MMTPQEFLQEYLTKRQAHQLAWDEMWGADLKAFFGTYYLERRDEAGRDWSVLPTIVETIQENDDTVSIIVQEEHYTKRYYIVRENGKYRIDRVMIRCELCDGTGEIEGDKCELCDGRGWEDWVD
jgi:hypothetical protein